MGEWMNSKELIKNVAAGFLACITTFKEAEQGSAATKDYQDEVTL